MVSLSNHPVTHPEKLLMEQEKQKEIDLSSVQYLVSDWDGTLVDSNKPYTQAFVSVMHSKFGIEEDLLAKFYKGSLGSPLSYQIKEVAKMLANINIEDTLPLEDNFWSNLTNLKPRILSGSKDGLSQLRQKGIKIAVWSGTKSEVLAKHIADLSFSSLVDFSIGNTPGSEKLVKGPGLFRIIADHFGLSVNDLSKKSLVIGDGKGDIDAGRAVGAIVGGIGDDDESPILKKADFIFKSLSDLAAKFR